MLDAALLNRLAPFALGGLAAGCLAWIAAVSVSGRSEVESLHEAAAGHQVPRAMGRAAPATADLLAMALFSPSSGAATADSTVAQAEAPATALQLHGISMSPRRRAALISTAGGPASWFAEGEEGAGFTVQDINRRSVTVAVAGAAQELTLYRSQPEPSQVSTAGAADTAAPASPAGDLTPSTSPEG